MIYLLIAALTSFFAWPYYHRFKGFKLFENTSPLPAAVFHGFIPAIGAALIANYAQKHGSLVHILQYDVVTAATFLLLTLMGTVWNAYLIFTAESLQSNAADSFEGVLFVCACICAVSALIGILMAYAVVSLVSAI